VTLTSQIVDYENNFLDASLKVISRNQQWSHYHYHIFSDGGVNFRKMQKGDYIALEYSQKAYLGKPFGMPDLKAAMVQIDGTSYFRFKNPKDDFEQTCSPREQVVVSSSSTWFRSIRGGFLPLGVLSYSPV
jgi:hypothetical protein